MFFLCGLQLFEQGVQALVGGLPELAVVFQPLRGFGERPGLEPSRPSLRVGAARDEAGALATGMTEGMEAGFKRLEALLATMAAAQPGDSR